MRKRILITGSDGRFAKILKKSFFGKNIYYRNKKQLDILNYNKIEKFLRKHKIKTVIHLAAVSRPMLIHEKKISKSIHVNIIGTANVVMACEKNGIKLIYFSTNYVYPGKKGNYKEIDPLLPINNYAWSKLGGEASVQMYKKSLILRLSMTEYPFIHKKAFSNIKTSFMYQTDVAKILPKLISYSGIINIGGKSQSPYQFAKKNVKGVKKSLFNVKKSRVMMPKNSSINLTKLKKILKQS